MKQPSSTITAATLAGLGMTVLWGIVKTFTDIPLDPTLVSGSTMLVSGWVGYRKKENVIGASK